MDFSAYLDELKDPRKTVVASSLTNLTALAPTELSLFADVWHGIGVARRRQILRHLLQLAEDNVELDFDALFIAVLQDEDAEVRYLAVQGLWEYEGRDLITPLIDLMERDPETAVRAQAAQALASYMLRAEFQRLSRADGDRVERALQGVILNPTESTEVRARALESAGARSASWVRRSIEEAYYSSDWQMRVSAVHAMGRHCDPRWLPVLRRELQSDDPEMRFEAANACAALGGEAAVPELVTLLEDDDTEVQEAAVAALGEIGGEEAKDALDRLVNGTDPRLRNAAEAALEQIGFNEDPLGFKSR